MTKLNFLINKYKEINQKLINEHIFPVQLPPKERKIFYKIDNLIFKKKSSKKNRHKTRIQDRKLFLQIITIVKLIYNRLNGPYVDELINDNNFDTFNSDNNFPAGGTCNFSLFEIKNDFKMFLESINNSILRNNINNLANKRNDDDNNNSDNDNMLSKSLKILHQHRPVAKFNSLNMNKQKINHNPNFPAL